MSRSIDEVPRPRVIIAIAIVSAVFIATGVVIRGRSFDESAIIVAVGAALGLGGAYVQRRWRRR